MLKRAAGREGLRHAHPGPRRHARPRRLVPVRRPGRDPVCRRLPSLIARRGATARRASRSSARPGRSGARRSTSWPRTRTRSRSSRSRPARTPTLLAEQAPAAPGAVALATTRPRGSRPAAGTDRVGGATRSRRSPPATTSTSSSSATGGVVSLRPVLAALRAGKVVATANKETLVAGGHLVMPLARARGRGVARRRPARPARQPARLAPPDRLGALGDLAVPRRGVDGRRRRA